MIYPDEATLLEAAHTYLKKWQPLLLLQEWDIQIKASYDLEGEKVYALTRPEPQEKRGLICLDAKFWLEGVGSKPGFLTDITLVDLEFVMVHELLHVRHAELDRQTDFMANDATRETRDEYEHESEKFANVMARILVSLERRGQWNGVIRASEITGEPVWTNGAGIK